ncbi:MAG TPA: hypothetical protein VGN80_19275 [Devosiaceae bacterium]|jgi:hypothetical protein|nr:hypothetical protein [Devosiaceae bacterium]
MMPVTRDPDFPAEIANLMQAFNACADGHNSLHVLEASANMLIAAIGTHARSSGRGREDAIGLARHLAGGLERHVAYQWDREAKAADVAVGDKQATGECS